MNIALLVAAHKHYWMPQDSMYIPVQVGQGVSFPGWKRDDAGDNISTRNSTYCELTALYWAWKNLRADWIGLVQYRRHFCLHRGWHSDRSKAVLSRSQLEPLLTAHTAILPIKRNYFIETIWKHYAHAHGDVSLLAARTAVLECFPAYLAAFDTHFSGTKSHMFNMFIMPDDMFQAWCAWLFCLVEQVEERLRVQGALTPRIIGHLSERLLDIWLLKNGIAYRELPMLVMERQNWLLKGAAFLERKFSAQTREGWA